MIRDNYDDIRKLSRPVSWHPKMHRTERAKLFAPFAALTGFEDSVHTRDRILLPKIQATEETTAQLNQKLERLQAGDYVTVMYFLPVETTPEGPVGEYLTVSSLFQRVDVLESRLQLDGASIPLEDIAEIIGENLT